MSVKVLIGDLFKSHAQTLVNTVNTVGVMGKGVALGFKQRFPEMYRDYVKRCERGEVELGQPYLFTRLEPPWILNFPTKDHWRSVAKVDHIVAGLEHLEAHYQDWGITSLAVPPLGCGEGQLEWRVVGKTLYRHLAQLDIPVELYAPFGTPELELSAEFLTSEPDEAPSSRIPAAWVVLAAVVRRITSEPYHYPVGRIMFQKISYFATQAGIPTGLDYRRGSYGPFSEDVKQLTARLQNNGIIVERRSGRMLMVEPGPTYRDAVAAFQSELEALRPQINRVADLLLRMDSHRAEVAASVHYVADQLVRRNRHRGQEPPSEVDVLESARQWKIRRKPPIADEEFAGAIRGLGVLEWVNLTGSEHLPVPSSMR